MSIEGVLRKLVYPPPPPVFVIKIAFVIAKFVSPLSINKALSSPFEFAESAWEIARPEVVPVVPDGVPIIETMSTSPDKSEVTARFSVPA
jgi:hypothetical protein